jgi:hypothetical protein
LNDLGRRIDAGEAENQRLTEENKTLRKTKDARAALDEVTRAGVEGRASGPVVWRGLRDTHDSLRSAPATTSSAASAASAASASGDKRTVRSTGHRTMFPLSSPTGSPPPDSTERKSMSPARTGVKFSPGERRLGKVGWVGSKHALQLGGASLSVQINDLLDQINYLMHPLQHGGGLIEDKQTELNDLFKKICPNATSDECIQFRDVLTANLPEIIEILKPQNQQHLLVNPYLAMGVGSGGWVSPFMENRYNSETKIYQTGGRPNDITLLNLFEMILDLSLFVSGGVIPAAVTSALLSLYDKRPQDSLITLFGLLPSITPMVSVPIKYLVPNK